jgi:hypothetical protein
MTDNTELYCTPKIEDNDFIEDDQNGPRKVKTETGKEGDYIIRIKTSDLIIFEENLTAEGLELILEESKTWPVVAHTPDQYKIVYDEHQRFKRLSLAIRKRAKEYDNEAKKIFTERKDKINNDMEFVLGIINPLITRLGDSRQRYDDETEAYKIQAAMIEAERQEAEFKRQELIRATQRRLQEEKDEDDALKADYLRDEIVAWTEYEREKQRLKDQELADEKARLERERYEFECEKTRLDTNEAWEFIEKYHADKREASEKAKKASSENYVNCLSQEQLDILLERLGFDEAWDEAHSDWPDGKPMKISNIRKTELYQKEVTRPWSDDDSTPLQDLSDFQEVVDDKPKIYGSIEKVIEIMEPAIAGLEKEHTAELEDRRMHAELGNLIARIKMNFSIFKDAINE